MCGDAARATPLGLAQRAGQINIKNNTSYYTFPVWRLGVHLNT
jgi:hypothetical protein